MKFLSYFSVITMVAAACGPDRAAPLSSPETITRTIVTVGADGEQTVEESEITAEEQQREIARREQLVSGKPSRDLLAGDPGCSEASIWLFDGPSLTGREICYLRTSTAPGSVPLWLIPRGTAGLRKLYWNHAVRSFWAGPDGGHFQAGVSPNVDRFAAWERRDSVSAVVAESTHVALVPDGHRRRITFENKTVFWYDGCYGSHGTPTSTLNATAIAPQTDSVGQFTNEAGGSAATSTCGSTPCFQCALSQSVELLTGVAYNASMLTLNENRRQCVVSLAVSGLFINGVGYASDYVDMSTCTGR